MVDPDLSAPSLSLGQLLEVQLDVSGVVLAVAGFHFLDDLRLDLPRQLTPGLAGVLGHVLAELTEVEFSARAADVAAGGLAAAALARLRLAALLTALTELVGRLLE